MFPFNSTFTNNRIEPNDAQHNLDSQWADRVTYLENELAHAKRMTINNNHGGNSNVKMVPMEFDSKMDVGVFLEEFRRCRYLAGWSDCESVCQLLQVVKGPAKQLLLSCSFEQRSSIAALEQILMQAYAPANQRESKLNNLERFCRHKGESLQNMYVRLLSAVMQVHNNSEDANFFAMRHYLRSLDDNELRCSLTVHQFKSVSEMHEAALKLMECRGDACTSNVYSGQACSSVGVANNTSENRILDSLARLESRVDRIESNGSKNGWGAKPLGAAWPHASNPNFRTHPQFSSPRVPIHPSVRQWTPNRGSPQNPTYVNQNHRAAPHQSAGNVYQTPMNQATPNESFRARGVTPSNWRARFQTPNQSRF